MNKTILVLKKELYRVFSDKKMIFSLYVLPVVIMFAMYSIMGVLIGSMEKDITEHIAKVTIVNATDELKAVSEMVGYDSAAEIEYITEEQYENLKADREDALLNGDHDLIVYLDPDFEDKEANFVAGGTELPGMKIYYNDTENYSSQAFSVYESMVNSGYKSQILANRYGSLDALSAFNESTEVICKEEKANTQFITMMLPYMIVMMLFAGVMSVGVDAIAGEKERGTLASMLISPVKRSEIVTGKLLSMGILSGLSSLVYCISLIVSFKFMGSNSSLDGMGFGGVKFNAVQIIELVVIMLALVYFYVGVVGLIATLSTNTKTASSAISPCYIVIIMAGMCTMFRSGSTPAGYMYMIPVYGNALAIGDLCTNELTTTNFLFSLVGIVVVGVLLTIGITKAFNSEKLMFNA